MLTVKSAAIQLAAASEADKPGPIALLIVVALGIAVYFLGRSMLRHLRSLPPSFSDTGSLEEVTPAELATPHGDEQSGKPRG